MNRSRDKERISPMRRNAFALAVGYWLLAIGYWLLAIGYWLLAIGYWLLAVGCWLLAIGCWLLAIGYWLLLLFIYFSHGRISYFLPLEPANMSQGPPM
jgi:hypothetical protein